LADGHQAVQSVDSYGWFQACNARAGVSFPGGAKFFDFEEAGNLGKDLLPGCGRVDPQIEIRLSRIVIAKADGLMSGRVEEAAGKRVYSALIAWIKLVVWARKVGGEGLPMWRRVVSQRPAGLAIHPD
jgi:hypothetical protein